MKEKKQFIFKIKTSVGEYSSIGFFAVNIFKAEKQAMEYCKKHNYSIIEYEGWLEAV